MTIADNLNIVRQAVDVAQKDTPVKLVAVSKTFPEEAIWEAYQFFVNNAANVASIRSPLPSTHDFPSKL